MAEIILPPEENEETPQVPELNIDKPTENSKVITIEFEAKKTNKVSTKDTNQQLYTTDTDAWFEFKETSLEGANGTYSVVFRNRHDGSIFQRTGDVVNGVAYYKIPHQEIRHAGAWRGQLVYTLENGNTTAREFGYDVKGHILDGKDVREIVVEDFETLMSQLNSMKDNAELELADLVNTAERNELERQQFYESLVEDINDLQENYQELLDTGVLQTNINEKLEALEEEYAPKLTEVTAQLAQNANLIYDLDSNKIDKNGAGQVTWANIAQDVREQVLGDVPPAVVGKDSVGRDNIVSNSVTLTKLYVPRGYLPLGLIYSREATNATRAVSNNFPVNEPTIVNAIGTNISFGVVRIEDSVETTVSSGWIKEFTIEQTGIYKIRARFDDDSIVTERLSDFENFIEVTDSKTAIQKSKIEPFLPTDIALEGGGISGLDGSSSSGSLTNYRSTTFIQMPVGSQLILNNKNEYLIAYYVEGASGFYDGGWISEDFEATTESSVRFMVKRKDGTNIVVSDIVGLVTLYKPETFIQRKDVQTSGTQTSQIVRYVSLLGSDDGEGTASFPYATLQKALDDNPNKIYIERGVYHNQTAVKNNIDNLIILAYGNESYSHDNPTQRQLAEFRGSDIISGWEPYNSIYRTTYSSNQYFNDVFINKTKPIETGGSRSTYNAVLWEGNNGETDYKMKPVLTLAECESEVGTFYYDGTYVYVNPQNINNEFNATKTQNGLSLSGDKITIVDIKSGFYYQDPFNLDNIKKLNTQRCEANHSGSSDGFSLDYTNGEMYECSAYKNRNDGFNMHYYGDTQLFNCRGINNYDDGVSHHEACTGAIYGGEWRGNGKGGISPVNNAKISVNNALIKGNLWALWNNVNVGITTIYNSCLFIDNSNGIMSTSGGDVISINGKYINNGADNISGGALYKY